MRGAFSRAYVLTIAISISGWSLCLIGQAASSDSSPVHQVLVDRSPTLLLDYFKQLAATLPPEERIPKTRQEWEKRREELRKQLWNSLGVFPLKNRPPLQPRVTGVLDRGDYVVEKIIYESLPGLFVTALMYVPKERDGRCPAVLCVNGHWREAKVTPVIQRRCVGLAKMGVVAFCQDVIGTGERAAPSDSPHSTYHGNYRGAVTRIVDRSLLGYVMYECMRAMDYLETRPEVDAKRVICTGASGGGKQSMFFAALDDRLSGAVPVCYVSNYQVHMGATACVGEIPTNVLRYSNQWEILGLHAPRPLLCINASRDIEVFQPRYMLDTLQRTAQRVYRLYGAEENVRGEVIQSGHAYSQPMRELLYNQVARHLLGVENPNVAEPQDLSVESAKALRCGLPSESETMQSLTVRRAREMVAAIPFPDDLDAWKVQRGRMLASLMNDIFGGFPDRKQAKRSEVRDIAWHGHRLKHVLLETEPGLPVPAVLCIPQSTAASEKRPAVLLVDERGKQFTFGRRMIQPLLDAGFVVLAIDVRGTGETAETLPAYSGAHDFNLSNYSLFCGRPSTGMRIHDVLCAIDFLAARPEVDASRIAYAGRGIAGLIGTLAAAHDDRIAAVMAEEMLTTWVSEEEFLDIGLGYLIPRILAVGDVGHLAACVAPRPLWIVNPVNGRQRPVSADAWRQAGLFAERIYAMHQCAGKLSQVRYDDVSVIPARLIAWLEKNL